MSRDTIEQKARQAIAALRALGRALAEERGFHELEPLPVAELEVAVTVPLGRTAKAALDRASQDFVRRLDLDLAERLRSVGAFEQGRVHCFLCAGPSCEHGAPPDRTSVFAGYTPNGRPEWVGFANLCLSRGDDRVDRLYAPTPEIIGVVQGPTELSAELLPGFGRGAMAWRLLGQLAIGLVPEDLAGSTSRADRIALTIQLVETGGSDDKRRIRLNLLGLSTEEVADAAAAGDERGAAEAFRRTLSEARVKVDALGLRVWRASKSSEPVDEEALALAVLTQLRGDLERVFRASRQRTRHAQERHLEGDRPTDRAKEDLGHAADEQCYVDTRRDTIVVAGPQRRAHVFARDGRLVTSLRLQDGELERKVGQDRWRRAAHGTLERLRDARAER